MIDEKVAYSQSRKNTVIFDQVTKAIYSLDDDIDIGFMEYEMFNRSSARRGSAIISERIFFNYVISKEDSVILEVGGNDGRHTRRFLAETKAYIHTFEPNIYAIKNFSDIVQEDRLQLNMYGLSSNQNILAFNILKSSQGSNLNPVNGCSSFNRLEGDFGYRTLTACCTTGARYLETVGMLQKPYCLWVDVEGHAAEVLSGFGDTLRYAEIVICEVENTDLYNSGANADKIIQMLYANGHKIVFRDFQNSGQFNIVSISNTVSINREVLLEPAQKFIKDVYQVYKSMKI